MINKFKEIILAIIFIVLCTLILTAGFGDVGFKGHWTLELVCVQPLKIYPGMKIAQITYQDISEIPNVSYDKKEDAKYSNQGKDPVASKNYLNK